MSAHGVIQDVQDNLAKAELKVSEFARAVALRRATILSVAGGLLTLAVAEHWIDVTDSTRVTGWLTSGLAFLTTVGAGAWIHQGTTPADVDLAPVDATGDKLVTATVAAKLIKTAMAEQLFAEDSPDLIPEDTGFDPNVPPTATEG